MQTRGVIISTSQMVTKMRRYDVPGDTGNHEGTREGARQVLMLGYQAALTLTTLAMAAAANLRDAGFPFSCRCNSMTSSFLSSCTGFTLQVDCWPAVPGSRLPRTYLWLVGSTKEIFWFCLADVVSMNIWQLFLSFTIMIWRLFTSDTYSCCCI